MYFAEKNINYHFKQLLIYYNYDLLLYLIYF